MHRACNLAIVYGYIQACLNQISLEPAMIFMTALTAGLVNHPPSSRTVAWLDKSGDRTMVYDSFASSAANSLAHWQQVAIGLIIKLAWPPVIRSNCSASSAAAARCDGLIPAKLAEPGIASGASQQRNAAASSFGAIWQDKQLF